MATKRTPLFECQECGKKYFSTKAAEKASFSDAGCGGCGGSDIDVYVNDATKARLKAEEIAFSKRLAAKTVGV